MDKMVRPATRAKTSTIATINALWTGCALPKGAPRNRAALRRVGRQLRADRAVLRAVLRGGPELLDAVGPEHRAALVALREAEGKRTRAADYVQRPGERVEHYRRVGAAIAAARAARRSLLAARRLMEAA